MRRPSCLPLDAARALLSTLRFARNCARLISRILKPLGKACLYSENQDNMHSNEIINQVPLCLSFIFKIFGFGPALALLILQFKFPGLSNEGQNMLAVALLWLCGGRPKPCPGGNFL
ncbi:MAG: hypothetical protein CM15mP21_3760 [Hyphomicrobiales bacterium]|nr:MAG: hypothetical protein CM15mP21_3760 [Hyphomicrobiales bacterium]